MGFVGVLIVVQPGGGELPLVGTLVALGAAFGVGCVTVTIRSISRTEGTQTTVLWFTLFSILMTGLLLPWFGQAHDGPTWLLLVAIGLTGGIGQLGLTASLRFAPISTLAPIDYLQLLFAVLFGWLLFGSQPALTTWAGAALIIASVLSTFRRKPRVQETELTSVNEL
jgi:drug/metabolite transporter (DMT)-like permease